MRNFIRKYLFFLNLDNPKSFRESLIVANIFYFFLYPILFYLLYFTENDLHSLETLNSGFIIFSLQKISVLWIEIYDAKNLISEIRIKLKERNWKYETTELYFITTILNYILIIFTWVFVIDWNIVGSFGIKRNGFLGLIIVLLSIFQYIKFIKQEKRIRKPDRKKKNPD